MSYVAFALPVAAPRRAWQIPVLEWLKRQRAERREQAERLQRLVEEAIEPTTSPTRLEEIWREACRLKSGVWMSKPPDHLARAIARHPNTPALVLGVLTRYGFLETVCGNPVVPLIPLSDDADLVEKIWDCRGLIAMRNPPVTLLALLMQSSDPVIAEGARLHIAMEEEIRIDDWRREVGRLVQRMIPKETEDSGYLLLEMQDLGMLPSWLSVSVAPTENADLSSLPIASEESRIECWGAERFMRWLRSPSTPPEQIMRYIEMTRDSLVAKVLLERDDLPKEFLHFLYQQKRVIGDGRLPLLVRLITHPHTDAALLEEIVQSCSLIRVRRLVRAHPLAGRRIQEYCRQMALVQGQGRCSFAASTLIAHLYKEIGNSPKGTEEWHYRLALVLGEQITNYPELLRVFAGDTNRLVRAVARARLHGEYEPGDFFRPDFAQ